VRCTPEFASQGLMRAISEVTSDDVISVRQRPDPVFGSGIRPHHVTHPRWYSGDKDVRNLATALFQHFEWFFTFLRSLHFEDESEQPGMVQLHHAKDELFRGCAVVRQKGSHIRPAHPGPPDRRITIPRHKPRRSVPSMAVGEVVELL
jgi:predicted RNA binding protein YcfA (HicA-like mRNA interferase family)